MTERLEVGWKHFRNAPYFFSSKFSDGLGLSSSEGMQLYFFSGVLFLTPAIVLAVLEGLKWIRVDWYWNALFAVLIGWYLRPIFMYLVYKQFTRHS